LREAAEASISRADKGKVMAKLSISRAWEESQRVLAHDGRLLASVGLALILLPQVVEAVVAPPPALSGQQPPSWVPLLSLVVAIAGLVGQIAIIRLALGPTTSVGHAISHGVRRFLPGLGAIILFGVPLALLMALLFGAIAGPAALTAIRAGTVDPAAARVMLVLIVLILLISARFQLIMPVTTAERGGPIHILRRTWELGRGHYLRLLGFLVAIIVTALIVFIAAQFLGGILARSLFGDAKPLSVSALIIALISGVVQTAFVVVVSTLLARIYAQVASRTDEVGEGFR
jgi:hypothetical protein